jgi:hypothetical protein
VLSTLSITKEVCAMTKQREDRFVELEERFAGYTVYDANREKIGKVDDLFVDEDDNPEYIGVKTGFLGTKSTLIPIELIRVNDRRGLVEIAADKDLVKDGPSFDDDEEITPEYEDRVRAHYGPGRGRQVTTSATSITPRARQPRSARTTRGNTQGIVSATVAGRRTSVRLRGATAVRKKMSFGFRGSKRS